MMIRGACELIFRRIPGINCPSDFQQSTPVNKPSLFPISGTPYLNDFSLAALEHTWTLNSRTVNSFRAGFLRRVLLRKLGRVGW
jgi:hypothetical protein